MTLKRFVLRVREDGVQEHNWYIDKLVKLIIAHDKKQGIRVEAPEMLYGMLCTDTNILQIWEGILVKEGLLSQTEIDAAENCGHTVYAPHSGSMQKLSFSDATEVKE